MGRMIIVLLGVVLLNSMKAAAQLRLAPVKDSVEKLAFTHPLPQNFYNKSLGFFCKKEIQFQKATSLPLFIRLGSKDYVDYLERKPNSLKKEQ